MQGIFLIVLKHWYNVSMEIDMNENNWSNPCPKYDCRKAACKYGLEYVNIPASLGDDSEGSNVAPKNGAYCNALVIYEANNHVYIYSKEGVPTLIDVDASDISTLEQEVRKAQRDIAEFREDIDRFAYFFNTVADMKASTNLQSGDYAKTLGYYSKNDGGGAYYKITNVQPSGYYETLGGMLYAELIVEEVINVKQIGAHGDNSSDDSSYIMAAAAICSSSNVPLYVPQSTYKIDGQISLKNIIIKCDGTLDNSSPIIIGAKSNGSTRTSVYIYKANDIQIEGAKRCYFNLLYTNDIVMTSDGDDSLSASQAYNVIDGVECRSFTITGTNGGWINDNEINIRRCLSGIRITSDGSYTHNNNRFTNICIEGSDKYITIDYGHDNYIYYRGEDSPVVTLNPNPASCWRNVIKKQYTSNPYALIGNLFTNKTCNFVGIDEVPTMASRRLVSVNLKNINKFSVSNFYKDDGVIYGAWSTFFESNVFPLESPVYLALASDKAAFRVRVYLYDEDGNPTSGNVGSDFGISYDSVNGYYSVSANIGKDNKVSIYPSEDVKKCKIFIQTGAAGSSFEYLNVDLITQFIGMPNIYNTIGEDIKRSDTDPSTETRDYDAGDIVLKTTPSSGVLGWYCTSSGNPGTWVEIPYNV